MYTITYKTQLKTSGESYLSIKTDDYINFLRSRERKIFEGSLGVYLSRKVRYQNQNLFFLFIDIDGSGNSEDEKITSSIFNTIVTLSVLKDLQVINLFTPIATGGTGFRLVSNVLVTEEYHTAFTSFLERELGNTVDLGPVKDTEQPHQLFAYKGHEKQSKKELVDRHSEVVHFEEILSGLTPSEYREITKGKLDPESLISFMRSFLNFKPILDISSLGKLGNKLEEFKKIHTYILKPKFFGFFKQKKVEPPLEVEELQRQLEKKGIISKLEARGGNDLAISFYNLPCPICKSTTSNARAYPPYYTLYCFNTRCKANKGVPLREWAGIDIGYKPNGSSLCLQNFLPQTDKCLTQNEVKEKILESLKSNEDTMIVVTPGAGKTHIALEYLSENGAGKTILYSCLNRDLQDEVYKKYLSKFPTGTIRSYKLQPREELCRRQGKLQQVISMGYSPANLLCRQCKYRDECEYYKQRENIQEGIYFVTHHMLPYLKQEIKPDMIVIDENLLNGFLLKETCTEKDIRTLSIVLEDSELPLLNEILHITNSISTGTSGEISFSQILNSRKIASNSTLEDSLINLLSTRLNKPEEEICDKISKIVFKCKRIEQELFKKRVSYKAVRWLEGFINPEIFSYIVFEKNVLFSFGYKYRVPFPFPKTPLKILDATGNEEVIKAITGKKVKVIRAEVGWEGERTHIKINSSRYLVLRAEKEELEKLLREAIRRMRSKKVMIVSYEPRLSIILELCNKIDPSKTYEGYHFHGPRGINKYEDCGAVIVLGLPYENLNNSIHEAHILFPKNEDLKRLWVDLKMYYELHQNIHRIRPIRKKDRVELVIISKFWPQILPAPTEILDRSHNSSWKEAAELRLKPLVSFFGFLSKHLAYLAGVYVTRNREQAHKFVNGFSSLVEALKESQELNSNSVPDYLLKRDIEVGKIRNLNFSPYYNINTKIKNISSHNDLLREFLNPNSILRKNLKILKEKATSYPHITLSTNQWSQLLKLFEEEYPHFREVHVNLAGRGAPIKCVGDIASIRNFYQDLEELGILELSGENFIKTKEGEPIKLPSLPDGIVCVHFKEDEPIILKKWSVQTEIDTSECRLIITNDAKKLFKKFLGINSKDVKVYDVNIIEAVIRTATTGTHRFSSFENYDVKTGTYRKQEAYSLYEIWQNQQKLIQDLCLEKVIALEMKLTPILSKLETTGIGIDVKALESYKPQSDYESQEIQRYLRLAGNDQRVHDDIKQIGTVTGRLSSQLHQVPKKGGLRSFFIPMAGYKFIVADYSQEELRIVAGLSEDENLISAIKEEGDFYLNIATEVLSKSPKECEQYRDVFKTIVLGISNGRKPFSIYKELEERGFSVTLNEVETFVQEYFKKYPRLKNWLDEQLKAREYGYVTTVIGRRRKVDESISDGSLCNYPIQGTAADILKLVLVELDKKLQGLDARVVHTMHDEIIVEARTEIAEKVAKILQETMEKVATKLVPGVPFKAEPKIQDSWASPVCHTPFS